MRPLVATALALLSLSCAPTGDRPHQRLYTEDLFIQVWMDPVPPRALEPIRFRVVVRDKESGEPIEGGEGRIFATNEDRKSINNGFTKEPEIGTYSTNLMFVTAGSWAVGLQFRRDSTQALQRVQDWMQQVYPERAPGDDTTQVKD
ncbi:MAG: hypothetical protein IPK85_19365 [Gemmatimonadetes bacterium]|nr:hypothetical protein [Gemmatimonadota bacterium]